MIPSEMVCHLFRTNMETASATTCKRQLCLSLIAAFEGVSLEDIPTDNVQRLFNGMHGAKTNKDKARMIPSQILNAAVEDNLIPHNLLNRAHLT